MRTTLTHLMPGFIAGILFSCLITSHSVLAQEALSVDWEKQVANTNGASLKQLTQIESINGLAYVAGYASTENGQQMYVARYGATGVTDWEINLSSEQEATIIRLVTGDGDLFVAGNEKDVNSGSSIIHYARISSEGNVVWHKTIEEERADDFELLWMERGDNGIYMIGSEKGENDYDIAWAAEADLNGNLIWKTAFDPGANTVFSDIQVNKEGTIAACGWADYGYAYLLVGFDDKGVVQWQYPDTLSGDNEKWFNDLGTDNAGNWIAVGSEETGDFFEYDAVTYKFDPNGKELWNRHYNNGGENYGVLLDVDESGNAFAFVKKEVDFDNMVRTISYDPDGNEQWATDYTIDDNTSIVDVEISDNGEIFLGVQDFDFSGFVKLSANGDVMNSVMFDDTDFDYLSDIAVGENTLWGCGYASGSRQSTVISLKSGDLNQVYLATSTGIPTSDVQVDALVSKGGNLWLANTSFQGSLNVFSISKLDDAGNLVWTEDKILPGSNPLFEDFILDKSGNSIGFFESLVNGGVTNLGLVKYDPKGNEVFYTVYDSSATLHAGAIATDPEENIYVGAYNQTSKLMFLSKLDPEGRPIWTEHYKSPSPSFPYAEPLKMVFTEQGKLVFAAVQKNADNVNNLYLFQYTSSGQFEWQHEIADQNGNTTNLAGLFVDDVGNIVVFGSSGIGQYVAATYNASGEQLWIDAGTSGATIAPRSMAVDKDGNIYLCFSSLSQARFRKLDASGNMLASAEYALPSSGSYFLPFGAVYVEDRLAVIGKHLFGSASVPFEILMDSELNLIYGRIDSLNMADFRAMSLDESGKINVVFTQGDINGGPGYRTALVRQYSIGMLESIRFEEYDHIGLYPNPALDQVAVVVPEEIQHIEYICLIDMSGRLVSRFRQNTIITRDQTVILNLPLSLSPGNSIVNLRTRDKNYIAHLIRQ